MTLQKLPNSTFPIFVISDAHGDQTGHELRVVLADMPMISVRANGHVSVIQPSPDDMWQLREFLNSPEIPDRWFAAPAPTTVTPDPWQDGDIVVNTRFHVTYVLSDGFWRAYGDDADPKWKEPAEWMDSEAGLDLLSATVKRRAGKDLR